MRNQNKLYNVQNNQNARKYLSPNQLKVNSPSDTLKTNKNDQYKQPEVTLKSKQFQGLSRIQKNKSQTSNQANSLKSSTQRSQAQQPKQRNSSKSRERKDYMNAHLAKFNRKKQEKPHSIDRNKEQKPKYIYTFKEEINHQQKVKQEYEGHSPPVQKNNKLEESVEKNLQGESSQLRSNNSSIAVTSKGKTLEVNVVKYDERNRRPSKEIIKQQPQTRPTKAPPQPSYTPSSVLQPQSESSILPPPSISQKRLPLNQATRIQIQSNNQYQSKFSQQLLIKLRNQRQQFSSRLFHLQSQKQKYIQTTSQLLQQKYQIQAQLTIALSNVKELQQQVDRLRDNGFRNKKQVERSNNNNEKMFKELQERYNSLLTQYRNTLKNNSQLSLSLHQQASQLESYRNSLRSAQQEIKNRSMEVENVRRVYQARMDELKQEHQFQIKQFNIKNSDKNRREGNLQETVKQLQRELQAKNRELKARDKEIDYLQLQLRDNEQLRDLHNAKCTQNAHLLEELNENKHFINQITTEKNQIIQNAAIQSKQKDKRINELLNTISLSKSKAQMQRISSQAHQQLFNPLDSSQSLNSFQQLLKSQSHQTNKLRRQISEKQQSIHSLSLVTDELKERVRRLEQELQLNARTYAMNLSNLSQMKDATEMMLKKRIATLEAVRNIH